VRATTSLVVPWPLEQAFRFFADPRELDRTTPPFLRFSVESSLPAGGIALGSIIDYRLRLHWVSVRWRTAITAFEPPHRFVDEQVRGPYRSWWHEHRFDPVPGGTRLTDTVEYEPRGGRLADLLLVRRDLRRILAFRRALVAR
jgi:ligand-binding SRPBCC domain-containing protein